MGAAYARVCARVCSFKIYDKLAPRRDDPVRSSRSRSLGREIPSVPRKIAWSKTRPQPETRIMTDRFLRASPAISCQSAARCSCGGPTASRSRKSSTPRSGDCTRARSSTLPWRKKKKRNNNNKKIKKPRTPVVRRVNCVSE